MAHEVTTMFYAGAETPWHGLGVRVPANLTCLEALGVAGLDWTISTERMWLPDGEEVLEVEGFRAVVRAGELPAAAPGCAEPKRVLGVVSDTWGPIQNRTIAELGDALAGQGQAACHTAGVLRGGAWVWMLLQLPQTIRVPGDPSPIEPYLLLSCRHDGSMAMRAAFTTVRVVCANTATAAIQGSKNYVVIKHTSGIDERIKEVAATIKASQNYFARYEALAGKLASARYTDGQLDELVETLYPAPPPQAASGLDALALLAQVRSDQVVAQGGAKPGTDAVALVTQALEAKGLPSAILEKRDAIRQSYSHGPGAMPGTAWGAVQAVNDAVDHGRDWKGGAPKERRFESVLFGDAAKLQQKAMDTVMNQVGL